MLIYQYQASFQSGKSVIGAGPRKIIKIYELMFQKEVFFFAFA